ncbi:MAG: hypothetical protein J2P45_06360 [Candidatus Dormibacteraeota bacterium]|nr:hypothetical protein [Candidatus Dormibacteraeota bacterium]
MSEQEEVLAESPKADANGQSGESEDKGERRAQAARRKQRVVAGGPPCPMCGKRWDDHDLAAIRDCTFKIEEAIKLAQRARIRAKLN